MQNIASEFFIVLDPTSVLSMPRVLDVQRVRECFSHLSHQTPGRLKPVSCLASETVCIVLKQVMRFMSNW